MITYLKLGKVRGLSIEMNQDLGGRPFFQKNSFHYETIIDIPYIQIMYTSERWVPKNRKSIRRVSNGNVQENKQTAKRTG